MRVALVLMMVLLTACGGSADDAAVPAAGGSEGTGSEGTAATGAGGPGTALTVEEALSSSVEGPLLVEGFYLHEQGGPPRLCAVSLESYPPQCGEPALVVNGLQESEIEGLTREGGTVWADQLQVLGTVDKGTITVDSTVSG